VEALVGTAVEVVGSTLVAEVEEAALGNGLGYIAPPLANGATALRAGMSLLTMQVAVRTAAGSLVGARRVIGRSTVAPTFLLGVAFFSHRCDARTVTMLTSVCWDRADCTGCLKLDLYVRRLLLANSDVMHAGSDAVGKL
jgi:hypothetical protein